MARSPQQQGRGGRGNSRGRGHGRGGRTQGRPPRQAKSDGSRPGQSKFKGNCSQLEGCIFDCSDHKQADKCVATVKRIAEHVGAEYKNGGDMRATIEGGFIFSVPMPRDPAINHGGDENLVTRMERLIFEKEVDAYVKRKSLLSENIQKACSLVLGQCTELMKSKLKSSKKWATISAQQDVLALLSSLSSLSLRIKSIYLCLSTMPRQASTRSDSTT